MTGAGSDKRFFPQAINMPGFFLLRSLAMRRIASVVEDLDKAAESHFARHPETLPGPPLGPTVRGNGRTP